MKKTLFYSFLYFLIGGLLYRFFQFYIDADGVCFITIAQKYLAGDFHNAVNGYWGPLLSWLLIPLLALKVPALLAIRLIYLVTGYFILAGMYLLGRRLSLSDKAVGLLLVVLAPFVYYMVYANHSPDILLTCFLVFYLFFIVDRVRYSTRIMYGIGCGLFGVLAYFSKNYGLPLFLVHFISFNLFYYFVTKDRLSRYRIIINFLTGMIVFCLFSGFWIYFISSKYGHFTVGNQGIYNHAILHPDYHGHPMLSQGLFPPPNNTAVSILEDVSRIKTHQWSPFQSSRFFLYQLEIIFINIFMLMQSVNYFSPLAFLILFFAFLAVLREKSNLGNSKLFFLFITMGIYVGGYLFLIVLIRYMWPLCLMIMLMGAILFDRLLSRNWLTEKEEVYLAVLCVVFLVIMPVTEMKKHSLIGDRIFEISNILRVHKVQGRLAANVSSADADCIAYLLDCKFYGAPRKTASEGEKISEISRFGIDYFLEWKNEPQLFSGKTEFVDIMDNRITEFRVYRISL